MSSEKPDQIQASVAAALSRLRGDLGPSGAAAPKIDDPSTGGAGDRPRPANDVRGDPFFQPIQSPPPGTGMVGRGAIPMTPFPRMQAPQEPVQQAPDAPKEDEASSAPEASGTIEIPEMPEREETAAEPVSMPEPPSFSTEPLASAAPPQSAPASQSESAAAAAAVNPLARMMRSPGQAGSAAPAQRDLLADLPPPPISEPLIAHTESGATRRKRRNRFLLAAAAVVIAAVLGAWLWTGGEPSTEVPVITADATPEKVKPAEEGGLQVQNQDVQVLDPSTQSQTETVMPEPEQPITPPASAQMPTDEQAPTVVENTAPESNAAPTVTAPAADVAPSPDVPLAETPLPAMEENGTQDASPAAPAASTPETTQTAETPDATEPTPAQDATAEATQAPAPEPAAAAEPATQPEPAQASQPEPAPAAQPEQPAAQEAPTQQAAVAPTVPSGNTRVQLAAGKSEASVQKEWASLQKAHPDLLGSLSLTVERVDKGASGVFYRLQAGPLADKTAAKQLCTSLKQKGQDCLVVAK
jgi:hypothetical protein